MPTRAIQNHQSYTGETFKHLDLHSATLEGVDWSECTFIRCELSEAVLRNCRLMDCDFQNCVLRMTEVPGCTFARVRFRECDLPGVNWSGWATKTGSLSFDGCNLRYCIFVGVTLTDFTLTDCNAQEVNFAEATLTGAQFNGTDFNGAIFLHTDLTEANFAGATRYTLNLNDNTTTDAVFALPEAIRLLHYLDITLIDPATDSEIDAAQLDDFIG